MLLMPLAAYGIVMFAIYQIAIPRLALARLFGLWSRVLCKLLLQGPRSGMGQGGRVLSGLAEPSPAARARVRAPAEKYLIAHCIQLRR